MKKSDLIYKLLGYKDYGVLYREVIEDLLDYIQEIDSDTIPDSVFQDFLDYHKANGSYQLQTHKEAVEYFDKFMPYLLDAICGATKDYYTSTFRLPLDKQGNWWSYETLILGAVGVIVAELHNSIFKTPHISLTYGWRS